MLIEQALRTQLTNDPTVSGLVSTRVYYSIIPQDTANPYVVMSKISAPRGYTHDGSSGLVNARFQFSIFATSYAVTKQIAAAIAGAISGFKGIMGGGVSVNGCFYDDETDLGLEPQTNLYHLAVDYKLWHNE